MIISKPSTKIIATILAKNEADIISKQIEHHLEQGIHKIIFTDNDSSDATREIASKYQEVVIIDEKGNDHHQSEWVSHMANVACKFKPDWIVHLDADEFWSNLMLLREFDAEVVGCESMYLHPPKKWDFHFENMKHFINTDNLPIPQECKVAHRPIENIKIQHGNHGVVGRYKTAYTKDVKRSHYPIRSFVQMKRKIQGHEALQRRGAICERWARWHTMDKNQDLEKEYNRFINNWKNMIENPSAEYFIPMLEFWSEQDAINQFKKNKWLPKIGCLS